MEVNKHPLFYQLLFRQLNVMIKVHLNPKCFKDDFPS